MGLMTGKVAAVFGVANERSLGWAIAQALHQEGAELAFNYLGEALERRVRPLASEVGAKVVLPCDVTKDDEIAAFFDGIKQQYGGLDLLIHSVAFADRRDLQGAYVETSREGFALALNVSAYSLVALCRAALPLMEARGGGSVVTLSYYGAEKVIPRYNVMGVAKAALEASVRYLAADLGPKNIRVNAISAGPVKTLASAGISGFKEMLHFAETKAPLKRNISQEEVGRAALFLCSQLASGITGQVIYVDAGYQIMGM
ncbi:MAG TPA: enoyl-ACP reductase [Nitrospiria bacterium]|nr:enoyl-ACP reductase [Nitrospiria bacterium]